ncbi:GerA spore germination protein [Alkaliphilus metalliredigens QYMF]|uniref:GerA spore germination protein n=1 Tax=Alkaliphilus metalliredigens (strain QYMF) TaxID=293826 RepID=A6TWV3_ALKMQ|nr:spore germination protein [Alkaliphilus metalliredigens]ABR50671.1 GerA spore germination protein [Alkaliphilus metalliredigens QYMF]
MGLWDQFFGKKEKPKKPEEAKINRSLQKNLETIKGFLKDCDDVVYREFTIGKENKHKGAVIWIDGMVNKDLINNYIMESLMIDSRLVDPKPKAIKDNFIDLLKNKTLAVSEIEEVDTIEDVLVNIFSGETALLLDDYEKIIIIASRGWEGRGISEPETEAVIRGPRDGFTETMRFNTALIRRRIRDHRLKVKNYRVGVRSQTDVVVMYMEDIANKGVLEEVDKRLNKIDVDAIIESGQLEEFIEDEWQSLFPQIQNTERPDVAAAGIYQGRVILVVDNTPFALMVPTTFNMMMQSAEDYYERWDIGTMVRILRYFCLLIALYAPALYVGISSFHPQMIPTDLALTLAATRRGVPFPAVIEALIMEVTIEILREAGVRLPGAIGSTIGIVGGLVIGQAAVEAGIVGPLMVIVVAITAIASFAIPSYNLAISVRLIRFIILFSAAIFGLYGIMLITLVMLIHLCSLKSFGMPYLSPFVTFVHQFSDLKDAVIRAPQLMMNKRDVNAPKNQKGRMDDHQEEDFDIEEKK